MLSLLKSIFMIIFAFSQLPLYSIIPETKTDVDIFFTSKNKPSKVTSDGKITSTADTQGVTTVRDETNQVPATTIPQNEFDIYGEGDKYTWETQTEEFLIPYETEIWESRNMERGKKEIFSKGENGKKIIYYSVRYIKKTGEFVDKKVERTEIIPPINEIYYIGTWDKPEETTQMDTADEESEINTIPQEPSESK